jgi:hypothetical protein
MRANIDLRRFGPNNGREQMQQTLLFNHLVSAQQDASLDSDQAWRQLLEECKDIATLQLPAHNHLAGSINAMHLKD